MIKMFWKKPKLWMVALAFLILVILLYFIFVHGNIYGI
jgi:hypothetical protein